MTVETLGRDLRLALRTLTQDPAFTLPALLTLALGLGANTAVFSVVNAVLFRPLPYHQPDRLVAVWTRPPQAPAARNPASLPDFTDWREQSRSFESMAAYAFNRFVISGAQGTDTTRGVMTTPGFFDVFGVPPAAGRWLVPSDDHARVAVLGDTLWARRYGRDPAVVGKSIVLNDDAYTIVGVMPPSFRFPTPEIELYLSFAPIYATAGNPTLGDWIGSRELRGYRVVGRLSEGVSLAKAQADMDAVAARLSRAYPEADADLGVRLLPLRDDIVGPVRSLMLVLLGAVLFVLLLACINVAHLTLARSVSRRQEWAVRAALGSTRGRMAREAVTESLVLALAGGLAGLLLAQWGVSALVGLSPEDLPRLEGVAIDLPVLGACLGLSLLAGLACGLAPVLAFGDGDMGPSLREGDRGATPHRGLRSTLVVVEVAFATVLVTGAGLMIRSFARLSDVNPGFPADHLLTARVFGLTHAADGPTQTRYYERVLERVRAVPGVTAAGVATSLPPSFIQMANGFAIAGRPAPPPGHWPNAIFVPATPGYLETLGVPLRAGRFFDAGDTPEHPAVAVVNETLVRENLSGSDPVGQRIQVGGVERTIVGVAGDVRLQGLHQAAGAQIFVPFAQSPYPGTYLVVRSAAAPSLLVGGIRSAVLSVDAEHGPTHFATMEDLLSESVATPRFVTRLLSVFGGAALLLAAVGIYGVIAYGVSQRRREIGVRVALGAKRSDVLRLVLRGGLTLALLGSILGIAASLLGAGALGSLLFETRPGDPLTLGAVVGVFVAVALLASYLPARRAALAHPMAALRED